MLAGDRSEMPGLVRISFGLYNTKDEIDLLIQALQAIRALYRELRRKNCPDPLEFKADPDLAYYLLNRKRSKIAQFQEEFGVEVHILPMEA